MVDSRYAHIVIRSSGYIHSTIEINMSASINLNICQIINVGISSAIVRINQWSPQAVIFKKFLIMGPHTQDWAKLKKKWI